MSFGSQIHWILIHKIWHMLWNGHNGYWQLGSTHLPLALGHTVEDIRAGGLQDQNIALQE